MSATGPTTFPCMLDCNCACRAEILVDTVLCTSTTCTLIAFCVYGFGD